MSDVKTHLAISQPLCGAPTVIAAGEAKASFVASAEMAADEHGLVHGGFVFGLADHAAMVAINDPFVVLGSSEVRFIAPVRVGDEVVAHAKVIEEKGKKRVLEVSARVGEREVLSGTMTAFVLERHILQA